MYAFIDAGLSLLIIGFEKRVSGQGESVGDARGKEASTCVALTASADRYQQGGRNSKTEQLGESASAANSLAAAFHEASPATCFSLFCFADCNVGARWQAVLSGERQE